MEEWPFAKYTGCGNDFLLFDNHEKKFPVAPSLIESLCRRQGGSGADGVILLEPSSTPQADFRFRIFNSNGSEAEMCGNGLRCFMKWLPTLGHTRHTYRIETEEAILTATQSEDEVCIEMGPPRRVQWNIPLRFEGTFIKLHYLNTGVPHVILFTDSVDMIDLMTLGPYLRNYSLWTPYGTNVTVAEKRGKHCLKVRTYERGVEGETLACGTGATAAALAAAHIYEMPSPIVIETRRGDELKVEFLYERQEFSKVTLTGPAECQHVGEINLLRLTQSIK